MSPRHVRCTVEALNYSACGLTVGQSFDVIGNDLSVPGDTGFCYFAVASVLSMLNGRAGGGDIDEWLESRPLLTCPDPPEGVHLRLELVSAARP